MAFDFRYKLPGDMYLNLHRAKNFQCPVLIIHGTKDDIIPFWNGQKLFFEIPVMFRAKPLWIEGAFHNNLEKIRFVCF